MKSDSQIKCEYRRLEENEEETKDPRPPVKKEFREDIALLRSLAILAVLGYHFWPKIFSFGFIGVDVFFVLSGYLMMSIMEKSSGNPVKIIFGFYYRRVKRIVPLYYLILSLIGLSMMFIYTTVWAKRYFTHYLSSILFYINFDLMAAEGDYFAEATEKMPFLHCWSLALEMQFYLIAPFIFFISKIRFQNFQWGIVFLTALFLFSLYFQFMTSPIRGFYHPISRIWQFLSGMIASFYTEQIKNFLCPEQANICSILYLLGSSLIFLPSFGRLNPPSFIQIYITISSSAFILFAPSCTIDWSIFRLGYISRISYSLYLIHFPVLRFSEYLAQFYDFEFHVSFLALLITFLFSIIIHHLFEAPMLRAKKMKLCLQILKYSIICLMISWRWKSIVHPECAHKSIVAENMKFLNSLYKLEGGSFMNDGFGRPFPPFGHYSYQNNIGKLKIMILGNSWATQQAHLIRKYFHPNETSQMDLFSIPSFTFGIHGTSHEIIKKTNFMMNYLNSTRPDYVFLLLRYHDAAGDLKPMVDNDPILKTYLKGIHNISQFTKRLFIESHQPYNCPAEGTELLNRFLDQLQKEGDLEKFNQPFNETAFYNCPVHQRLKVVFEKCSNCRRIDVADAFIDHKKHLLMAYDPNTMMSYLDNGCHLTATGLDAIEKYVREAIDKGIKG